MATGYNPYDTHQTILAGIKSPDPCHGWQTMLAGCNGCNKMRKNRAYEVQTEQCTIQKHKIQYKKKKKKNIKTKIT